MCVCVCVCVFARLTFTGECDRHGQSGCLPVVV